MRRTSVVRGGGDMLVGSFDRFLHGGPGRHPCING